MKAYSALGLHGQRLVAVGLVAVLLLAFVAVPQAFAETSGAYEDISVDAAYKMIKEASGNLVILDVRNQSEYNLGHLYDAVLIPVYELEDRIGELQEHVNDPIIVYCKAGSRSQIACQILISHGFTKVYNMIGGITAWMKAGYPIYTTSHYITVNLMYGCIHMAIEPMLLHQDKLLPWSQNQTSSHNLTCPLCGDQPNNPVTLSNNTITVGNITVSMSSQVLSQDADHAVTQQTVVMGSTVLELTINITKLWLYNETISLCNRTAGLLSLTMLCQNVSLQYYGLFYEAASVNYNLTVATMLVPFPLDNEVYAQSVTSVRYSSTTSKINSAEAIQFNSSIDSLSHEYSILGYVAQNIGSQYQTSLDKNLTQLAPNYYYIASELWHLSSIVKSQIPSYNKVVLSALAFMIDPCDDVLKSYIEYLCGIPFGGVCTLFCALVTGGIAAIACPFICGAIAGAFCVAFADAICGVPITVVDLGCGAICGAVVPHFGDPLTEYCAGAICGQICSSIWSYLASGSMPSTGGDGGGGGGGCPRLSVYDGSQYVSQGFLDIHASSDVLISQLLNVTPATISGMYHLCLTEHPQTISHINHVKLYANLADGTIVSLPLIYAIHNQWGNVLPQLLFNDTAYAVEVGTNWNSGTSQSICLGFLALPPWLHAVSYTFVVQGHNMVLKV